MRFRLKVVGGQPRAIFADMDPQHGELLSKLLAPSPYYITILLWEITLVQKKRTKGWTFDDLNLRLTCTPESLIIKESMQETDTRDRSAYVELTLEEAEQLLSKWRFKHVGWEFRQTYRKAKEDLKMNANISQQEERVERPILFRVSNPFGHHLGFARDLVGAVSIAAGNRRRTEKHGAFSISVVYSDGSEDLLPPERYCRRKEVTTEDALHYIRTRDEGIRIAKEIGISELQIEVLLGEQVDLCSSGDPEHEQVQGYIKNAPEMWRTDEELKAEETNIFRKINSCKQKRQAKFVFST